MIPKTIHYCWFGRGKKPYLIRKCIESWRRVMPDYEIKEWNEDNFDVNALQFTREAYAERKWAFVADVCRFYACYTEGGIYLDTDVEVFKRFDEFLKDSFFTGIEYQENAKVFTLSIDASVFGCSKGNEFAKECLDFYEGKPFRMSEKEATGGTVQAVATMLALKYGFRQVNETQSLTNGIKVYSTDYFCNISNTVKDGVTYSLHHFDGSWVDYSNRGLLYRLCRKYDMVHVYKKIEKLLRR